ncbi:hypothetical protein K490DRAFT_53309 [Saccharata proteae CBS 121410]|uniref:Uncharacterized protein n=1 Tax=Saccharata proteae CBS 121410 TaxID=1314787 RepID=A0A9P4HZI0_9PEZI|nr:hypothetical protein K490DRAFT_53309 [Saccharata proteae CBS 121410]
MSFPKNMPKKTNKGVRFADDKITVLEYKRFSRPEAGFERITTGMNARKRAHADADTESTPLTPPQTPERATKRVHFQDDDNVTLEFYDCSSPASGFLAVTRADTPPATPTTSEDGSCRYTGYIPKVVHFGGWENVILEYSPSSTPESGFTSITRFFVEHYR